MITEEIDIDTFRETVRNELSADNEFLAGWQPNSIIHDAVDSPVGNLRPWTKVGREYHGFYKTFYCTLAWYKLWKIGRCEQTSWNLDKKLVGNISRKFNVLIDYALAHVEEDFYDDERHQNPSEWMENYDPEVISRYTATDYLFQNITDRPIRNVLDFGSGIGRQAYSWFDPGNGVNFVSVDAIESLYLLQNKIYSLLYPEHLKEYCFGRDAFQELDLSKSSGTLYHLPTWRMDRLPARSVDLIICVQVLNELNEPTVKYLLKQFERIAKQDCVLYIRDNEIGYTPGHNLRVGRLLLQHGFELLFRYQGSEAGIEGQPRVWAYTGVERSAAHFRLKRRLANAVSFPGNDYDIRLLVKSIGAKLSDWGLPL